MQLRQDSLVAHKNPTNLKFNTDFCTLQSDFFLILCFWFPLKEHRTRVVCIHLSLFYPKKTSPPHFLSCSISPLISFARAPSITPLIAPSCLHPIHFPPSISESEFARLSLRPYQLVPLPFLSRINLSPVRAPTACVTPRLLPSPSLIFCFIPRVSQRQREELIYGRCKKER